MKEQQQQQQHTNIALYLKFVLIQSTLSSATVEDGQGKGREGDTKNEEEDDAANKQTSPNTGRNQPHCSHDEEDGSDAGKT